MGDMTLPIERYIANFCSEIPAPPPGSFEVQTTILDSGGTELLKLNLEITKAIADEGPTLKRFRPRARGSAGRINKRTSHILIELESVEG